jgi:hypothetical protein
MTPTSSRRPFISSGDSGMDGCENNEPEDLYGPVDITDEVFEDTFNNSKPGWCFKSNRRVHFLNVFISGCREDKGKN